MPYSNDLSRYLLDNHQAGYGASYSRLLNVPAWSILFLSCSTPFPHSFLALFCLILLSLLDFSRQKILLPSIEEPPHSHVKILIFMSVKPSQPTAHLFTQVDDTYKQKTLEVLVCYLPHARTLKNLAPKFI